MRKLSFKKLYQIYRIWLRASPYNQCRWIRFNHEYDYETDCSNYYEVMEPQSVINTSFKYCPYCGKPIVEEVLLDGGSF